MKNKKSKYPKPVPSDYTATAEDLKLLYTTLDEVCERVKKRDLLHNIVKDMTIIFEIPDNEY